MSSIKGPSTASRPFSLFGGEGEMAALMRAYDWESHPMGKPEQWPESLKIAIRLILNSNFPMFIWWSKDLYMFHNDAYLPALGEKHPRALGASARKMWREIWGDIGQVVEEVIGNGRPFYAKELQLFLERKGFSEETFWTFSYSPAPDDEGGIGGLFCACNEETKTVLGQRRLRTIKDVADATVQVETLSGASLLISEVLSNCQHDVPFSLTYILDREGTKAKLLGQSGKIPQELAPVEVNLLQQGEVDVWSLVEVWRSGSMKAIQLSVDVKGIGSGRKINEAVVLPILKPGEDKLIGFFVSGISTQLEYDGDYKNFHELLVGQIATSFAGIQAREEVKRQQEELINLFQQAPVAIAILRGTSLIVELANPSMCVVWGRTYEQVINKPVFEALPEAKGQGLEELLEDVLVNGATHAFNEFPLVLRRGGKQETIYANFIYYPFRNSKGVVKGVTAIAVEVTEQVEARQQIEEKNKELVAINADLDNFVYSASHDLKGPILNIEGLMKVLMPRLPEESLRKKEVETVVKMIFGSIERLQATISDLSEVSRVQKEANEDVQVVDVALVVNEVLKDMELEVQKSGAIIETNFQSRPLLFSPKNLRSIIYNLLSNAIKYRSPDREPHIRLFCEEKDGEMVFAVKDNGLGMNLKYKEKIFSMFKRLHSHVEGTGIGLYIVKRIVENAGGRIEVESKLGEGSTFTIHFKL
ncbi:sensor histidine kinase [Nafulsella turpanensis]|uniref:sensor histidine kinase n=1 Tax=Nafulsella turpanensis TaxID=1265690 RepID=UPI00034AC6F9|nr:PAS domain-containing sensor histidine kinase [Nafulsella turpanensis]